MASDANQQAKERVSPVLGLPVSDAVVRPVEAPVEAFAPRVEVSVIVPARNEELNLPACLRSLLEQDDELFKLGRDWELLLVDDASVDGTLGLMKAVEREGVRVLQAPALDTKVSTGKSAACWFAAGQAGGAWLLFTDADTVHEPKSVLHAVYEAKKHKVALLSYSPRQIVTGLAQRALMPLVFSELASVYKMSEVNDPGKKIAAANGQFLMVERGAYFSARGHMGVAKSVLEDVDLAWNVKRGKKAIRFRYAPDALSTRMYRGVGDMVEGWTKNLALLFPHALSLAFWRLLDIGLFCLPLLLVAFPYWVSWQKIALLLVWARTLMRFYRRVARSHFPLVDVAISPLGLPLFIVLLVRSWMMHKVTHRVSWKGREYRT